MTRLSAETRIVTDSAARYLVQLCRHAAAMADGGQHRITRHRPVTDEVELTVESSETEAVITFGSWGRCTVRAEADALIARVDGADEEKLARIQGIIGRNLDRFARREGATVAWERTDITEVPGNVPPGQPHRTHLRRLGSVGVPAVVAALVVAIHLGLGGAALTNWNWTSGAITLILLVVLAKAAIVFGGFTLRRMRSHRSG